MSPDTSTGVRSFQATLPPNLTVGLHPVTLYAVGQSGVTPFPLEAACQVGFFGHANETCVACPAGGQCVGFNASASDPASRYPYPTAIAGFFNLNGAMASACPSGNAVPGRDVCIVACVPADACDKSNVCSTGYASKPPFYRCGSCAANYYPTGNTCALCPNSPYSIVVVFVLAVLLGGAAAYVLNKKNINIAFISIGLDFMQVMAMFANAGIPWPPAILKLFQLLSAFNLNIQIVAPECLVPSVSFTQKFAFIVMLPLVLGFFFVLMHVCSVAYKALILGRRKNLQRNLAGLVSSFLLLFYVLYLYLTTTMLSVFNCVPTNPPDGQLYMTAVFEPCGVPGGVQLTLAPWAVLGLIFYSGGYPAFVLTNLYRNRERAMEDQLLRAKNTGNDQLTNPNAYRFRRSYGRTYYQFKVWRDRVAPCRSML